MKCNKILRQLTMPILTVSIAVCILSTGCKEASEKINNDKQASVSAKESDGNNSVSAAYLSDLLFEGYEQLPIEEYRERIKNTVEINENDYKDFFEAVESNANSSELYEPGTDEYYLFNVIIPTISKRWLNISQGCVAVCGQHQIEYSVEYNILSPQKVTVQERDEAIARIYNSFKSLAKDFSEGNYGSDNMQIDFAKEVRILSQELSNESFKVTISGACRLEQAANADETHQASGGQASNSYISREEYDQLLSLRDDIASKTVADFLETYVEHIQSEKLQSIQQRVFRSIAENKIPEYITDEELEFLTITLEATSKEFVATYQEQNNRTTVEYRIDNERNPDKAYNFFMNYELQYEISDNTKLQLSDRDARIKAIRNGIEEYINGRTENELKDGAEAVESFADKLADECSNDDIKFNIFIRSYKVE